MLKNQLVMGILGALLMSTTVFSESVVGGRDPFEITPWMGAESVGSQEGELKEKLRTDYFPLAYARAEDIATLLRGGKGGWALSQTAQIGVDTRTNTVIVQESAERLQAISALIERLDVPVPQVLIESRVVMAHHDFDKALGVHWGLTHPQPIAKSLSSGDRLQVHLAKVLPGQHSAQFGLAFAKLPGDRILDLELSALESEGLGQIISSPRLLTSNQQKAYIESGEEIPYQETTASGATAISFKKAALRLEVTPYIAKPNQILLDLTVNQDSRGAETAGVPAIHKQEMHTQVLVTTGETIVLGGIYQQIHKKEQARLPLLGRVPGLRWLFGGLKEGRHRSELMIFVTPKIIS